MLSTIRIGEGQVPVLLLHGFLGSGRNLSSFARRWSLADPSLSILLPDLPGHGTSPGVGDETTLATIARAALGAARAAGFDGPVDWVGHSFGGRISLAAALEIPEAVRSITLLDIGPAPIPAGTSESALVLEKLLRAPDRSPDRETMRRFLLDQGLSQHLTEWLLMNLVHDDKGYSWRIDREALRRMHERLNRVDLWEAVERKIVPVRCVRGGRSRYLGDDDARRLEEAGCPVATLEGAGPFVHVDAPDGLLALVTGQASWR